MNLNRLRQRGFSLVELMIVVAIIGVLSTLAIQGVRRYLTNAKTAEAKNSIGTMARAALDAFEREKSTAAAAAVSAGGLTLTGTKQFCGPAAARVPTVPPIARKYQSTPADWDAGDALTGWRCLKFSVDSPQAYSYGYAAVPTISAGSFTASAQGDLDGDGVLSTFEIFGGAVGGVAKIGPTIAETNPDE